MPDKVTNKTKAKRIADQYNDRNHNYLKYWSGRDYENAAEEMAIKRLLKGKHFKHAVDIGGGYGRLCVLLEQFAGHVTLAEPSQQQLDIAADYLKKHSEIDRQKMQADDLKFSDGSIDLITMIRVMHHLPNPGPELGEIARALSKNGYAIIEVANYSHFRNRLKHAVKLKKMPLTPVDIRSKANQREDEIPFVNHNPKTVVRQLKAAGFEVVETLSVSNLRSPTLKKYLPKLIMISVEKLAQKPLSSIYFGPSIFFLVRKK